MYRNFNHIVQMVLIDLDGTLLNNDKEIGLIDYQTLVHLGEIGITRVFATGRNLYSAFKVLADDCPFDYLVFSSGAGIFDWKLKQILFQSAISNLQVVAIEAILRKMDLNFSIHYPVPENHKYYYFKGKTSVADFDKRNEIYNPFCYKLNGSYPLSSACQFLIILNHENEIELIKKKIKDFKVIRATSPLDGKSIWIEIFNNNVSKALGGMFLCEMLNISHDKTLGIGNDYNDLDLLDWTAISYMVSNAPENIKVKYNQCADNQNNPLSDVLERILNQSFT